MFTVNINASYGSWRMLSNFRTWKLSTFAVESHCQMMGYSLGTLSSGCCVPALQEPCYSHSVSVGPICCTSELCNVSSAAAAAEPCCGLICPVWFWEGRDVERGEQSNSRCNPLSHHMFSADNDRQTCCINGLLNDSFT